MGKLRRLFLFLILFSVLMMLVFLVLVFFQFQGQISVGNLSVIVFVLFNLSVGEWQVEVFIGDIIVIFNMSVGSVFLVVEINGLFLDDFLKGFLRVIVFFDGKRVLVFELEEMFLVLLLDWIIGEGVSLMIGLLKLVFMGIVIFLYFIREYFFFFGGFFVVVEYVGVKKYCLIDILGDKNSWSVYGSCFCQLISNVIILVLVGIILKFVNVIVYVNGFYFFGEWFILMRFYFFFIFWLSLYNVLFGINGYLFVFGVVVFVGRNFIFQVDFLVLFRLVLIYLKEGILRVLMMFLNVSIVIFVGNQKVFFGRSLFRLFFFVGIYIISVYLVGYGGVVKNVMVLVNGSVLLNMIFSFLLVEFNVVMVFLGVKVKVGNRMCIFFCFLNLIVGVYNVLVFFRGYFLNFILIYLFFGIFRNVLLNLVKMLVFVVVIFLVGVIVEVGGGECIMFCNFFIMLGNYSFKVEKGGYEEVFMIIIFRVGEVIYINIIFRKIFDKIFI